MSYPISRREQVVTVPANGNIRAPLYCDYLYLHTVPTGVVVRLNEEAESSFIQGELHQAEPGSVAIHSCTFLNTTGSALEVRIVFGLGRMSVVGVATLSGAIPLPTGAATAALQTAGNTSLAALALASSRTARAAVVSNTTTAFNGKKSIAVANRATSTGNVTVTFADASTLVLEPGEGMSWAVPDRLDTLDNLSVTSPDDTTFALVSSVA